MPSYGSDDTDMNKKETGLLTVNYNHWLAQGIGIWRSRGKRDLLMTGLADIFILAISLVTGILTARLLGPEGRGQLAVVILWPSVIAAIGSLGVRDALVYEQARGVCSRDVLTGVALLLASLQSFALILIGWFLIPILTRSQTAEVTTLTRQFLIFVFLNFVSLYMVGLLHGRLHIVHYNITRISVNVIYVLGLLVLWGNDVVTVKYVAYALLIANAVTATLAVIFAARDSGVSFHFRWSFVKTIFNYGLKSHVGSISQMFNERLDQMVLALLLSPKELGWYVVAVSTANITKVAASPFAQMVFPRMTGQDRHRQRNILRTYSRFAVLCTGALALFLFVTLPFLLPVVYGDDFVPSLQAAQVLVIAAIFLGIGSIWRQALAGMGQPFIASQAELFSLVVTAIGIYFFVPPYGILGAAWVSLVAYSLATFYLGMKLKHSLEISWRQTLGL